MQRRFEIFLSSRPSVPPAVAANHICVTADCACRKSLRKARERKKQKFSNMVGGKIHFLAFESLKLESQDSSNLLSLSQYLPETQLKAACI